MTPQKGLEKDHLEEDTPFQTLLDLFDKYSDQLEESLWPWEMERWYELVFCILLASGQPDVHPENIRMIIETLGDLDFLDITSLAGLHVKADEPSYSDPQLITFLELLKRIDFPEEKAKSAIRAICKTAVTLQTHHNSKIQHYLRGCGNLLIEKISTDFELVHLPFGQNAVSLWLQNVSNMPVVIFDPLITAFCEKLGVSYKALIEMADQMDINVALLDDMLRAHRDEVFESQESAEP